MFRPEKKYLETEKQESISEVRKRKIGQAMERIKKEFSADELASFKAILLLGSTARGTATEKSDVDFFIILDGDQKFNREAFQKIQGIIDEELPDVEKAYGYRAMEQPRGKAARFITAARSGNEPVWEFMYSRDEKSREEINSILNEAVSQRLYQIKRILA